ncbi:hypothetical protein [Paenibacillus sp. CR_12]
MTNDANQPVIGLWQFDEATTSQSDYGLTGAVFSINHWHETDPSISI